MTYTINRTSVTTVAEILAANANAVKRLVKNEGGDVVYIGGDSSVTTSNGFPVSAGEELLINDYSGAIYAISAGTTTVEVVEHQ